MIVVGLGAVMVVDVGTEGGVLLVDAVSSESDILDGGNWQGECQ